MAAELDAAKAIMDHTAVCSDFGKKNTASAKRGPNSNTMLKPANSRGNHADDGAPKQDGCSVFGSVLGFRYRDNFMTARALHQIGSIHVQRGWSTGGDRCWKNGSEESVKSINKNPVGEFCADSR